MEESKKASSGNTCLDKKECNYVYQLVFDMLANLTIDSADNPGVNPEVVRGDEQYAQRQLKVGERVLTQVRREKKISRMPIPGWALNWRMFRLSLLTP